MVKWSLYSLLLDRPCQPRRSGVQRMVSSIRWPRGWWSSCDIFSRQIVPVTTPPVTSGHTRHFLVLVVNASALCQWDPYCCEVKEYFNIRQCIDSAWQVNWHCRFWSHLIWQDVIMTRDSDFQWIMHTPLVHSIIGERGTSLDSFICLGHWSTSK